MKYKTFLQKILLILLISATISIRNFFILNSLNVADVALMKIMAEKVIQGINPYINSQFYVYPPLGLAYLGACLIFARSANLPFHLIIKILPNIADFAIAGLLFLMLRRKKVSRSHATFWSLFYLLNPMTIITSTAHGQLDTIPMFLVLLSLFMLELKNKWSNKVMAMFTLGISFAIKPTSVVLLPLFILGQNTSWQKKIVLLFVSFFPVAVSFLPFISKAPLTVFQSITNYSGSYDLGYAGILRALRYQDNAYIWLVDSGDLLRVSKIIFFVSLVPIYLFFGRAKELLKGSIVIYLLYYTVYFGLSAQHLIWVLPLAILALKKEVLGFTLVGFISYLGFYTFFGPDILFGNIIFFQPHKSAYMSLYFFGNLLLWICVSIWLCRMLVDYLRKK